MVGGWDGVPQPLCGPRFNCFVAAVNLQLGIAPQGGGGEVGVDVLSFSFLETFRRVPRCLCAPFSPLHSSVME